MADNAGQRGFTLLEMLLSVAIITILASLSLPLFQAFSNRNDLDLTTQMVAEALRHAQANARGMQNDTQWGVRVQSTGATLFKGASYAVRDTSYDQVITIPSTMTVGGTMGEVVFAKMTALPSTTGTMTLTSPNNDVRTITLNAGGMVDY